MSKISIKPSSTGTGTFTIEAPNSNYNRNFMLPDESGVVITNNRQLSFRNKIINGNFDIWQRGTSQTTSGYGSADRWRLINAGTTKIASRQEFTTGQTEVPGNPKYFMRHVITSVNGATNYCTMEHNIESVCTLSGKTATLSFWAKADAPKNIAIEFYQYFGTGGSPSVYQSSIGSQLIALTSTWQKYTVIINIPSISGKVLGTDNNDYIKLYFWFDAGSSFASRTANLSQQSGTFDIAQVQLEEGSVATPFEERPLGVELELCQRYYEKFGGTALVLYPRASTSFSTSSYATWDFKTVKRATPTVFYSAVNLTSHTSSANPYMTRFTGTATSAASVTDMTADAEL